MLGARKGSEVKTCYIGAGPFLVQESVWGVGNVGSFDLWFCPICWNLEKWNIDMDFLALNFLKLCIMRLSKHTKKLKE